MNNLKFNEPIFVTRPLIPPIESYNKKLQEIWDNKWLTNYGPLEREFQIKLKEKYGLKNIETFANGHISLEIALKALDLEGEVITTPFTFASTTQAIIGNRLTPVFADIDQYYYNLNPENIEDLITDKTSAIVPVHVFGNPCELDKMAKIAKDYDLKLIYDAAHAFGVKYKDKGIGNYGDASVFSFHATKVFNTIEGGAITFSDQKLYDRLYNLKNFGIRGEELVVSVGANAKMNEFAAVMGLCNLKHIDEAIDERKKRVRIYHNKLENVKGVSMFHHREECSENYAYFPIIVGEDYRKKRDELYDLLKKHDIYSRKYFYPLTSDQACFKNKYKKCELDHARSLAEKVLVLPLYEKMEIEAVGRIVDIIQQ